MASKDDERGAADRRGFFRLGLERLRTTALEAARELARASAEIAEASAVEPERYEGRPDEDGVVPMYHRARRRTARAGSEEGQKGLGRRFVRPPGAKPEREFLASCERCRKCVDACPEHAIFSAGPQHGPELELTPILMPAERACLLCQDVPCASACPSGALVPLPAAEIRIGLAAVTPELCLNRLGQTCDACLHECPFPGVAIRAAEDGVPLVDDSTCTGCGLCALHCRAYPKAIQVLPIQG